MAKKDWKEIEVPGRNERLWSKRGYFIRIFESQNQITLRVNKGSLTMGSRPLKTLSEKGFSNIEEAVKYAESYMESH